MTKVDGLILLCFFFLLLGLFDPVWLIPSAVIFFILVVFTDPTWEDE